MNQDSKQDCEKGDSHGCLLYLHFTYSLAWTILGDCWPQGGNSHVNVMGMLDGKLKVNP